LSSYWLLAGVFGVCALGSLRGTRRADHGPESVADCRLKQGLRARGAFLVGASLLIAILSVALFMGSVRSRSSRHTGAGPIAEPRAQSLPAPSARPTRV
jgi:hypothetical protein